MTSGEVRGSSITGDGAEAPGSVRDCFLPRAVAVIGASRHRGTIAGEVFRNLLEYGFEGPVYPVNPNARVVQAVPAYANLSAVPGPVDLAVLVVPAAAVLEAARDCAARGVKALLVISSGFAEAGEAGRQLQDALAALCRSAGMRLIGPNCMGLINTDPAIRLNATFAPQAPPRGRIGFLSQSGALGLAIIDHASAMGLGLSTFVSVGNKADVSSNDMLVFWESDPSTSVILLYLESFGNPRKFSRIARRVARQKPIAVVKSGRSQAGTRATGSHTGALLAASDVTVDALFRQTGVIRTDTLEQLFDIAALLAHQPAPRGRRVGIITNAGGPGILCADTCEAEGLEIPLLSAETQQQLREFLPAHASPQNPVDMVASAPAEHFRRAIRVLGADSSLDALIVIFIPPLVTRPEDVARAMVEGVAGLQGAKPVLTVFMSAKGIPEELQAGEVKIPSYAFPESAALALARAARYGEWRQHEWTPPARPVDLQVEAARALVAERLAAGAGWMAMQDVQRLFACYGLPLVQQVEVPDIASAVAAAQQFDGAIALKAIAPGLLHKSDVGGVRLNLKGAQEVEDAAVEMMERLHPRSLLLQRMSPAGVELLVGVVHDAQFGPVVACGAGGTLVELMKDVSVALTPVNEDDIRRMLERLKIYPMLTGYRGSAACDVTALRDAILRIGFLVEDVPEIQELDCNPIIAHSEGAVIVDARVRLGNRGG